MKSVLTMIGSGALALLLGACGESAELKKTRQAEQEARDLAALTRGGAPAPAPKAEAEPPKPLAEEKPKESGAEAPKTAGGGTVSFGQGDAKNSVVIPAAWKEEKPSNNMRLAQIKVPRAGGDTEDGEVTIFKFGGGVDANLTRWAGQFGGESSIKNKKTLKTASGAEATVVELEGTYTGAPTKDGPAAPKKDYKMLGAILVVNGSEFQIKLPGQKATVDAAKADFDKLVQSFK